MIDLHSHILFGIDDGAKDINLSLEMARLAVADGTTHIACTPHIMPSVYENTPAIISSRMTELQNALNNEKIPLKLIVGADAHLCFDMVEKLQAKAIPTLANTKYFLFEPPHRVLPPNITAFGKKIINSGYIPILTHPERLTWIETHYENICELDEIGMVIQITAASITGQFGSRAKYWAERMLDEGRVDIIASDAHDTKYRPPGLSKAKLEVTQRLSNEAANRIFFENPSLILNNKPIPKKTRVKLQKPRFEWLLSKFK